MATPNYDIDYNDKRLTSIQKEENKMMSEAMNTYDGMIEQSDGFYKDLANNAQNWADKQTELQNEQTAFTIDTIEQQRAQAQQDYIKEQSGAYADWQKQSNQYGANAEHMAANGLANTGFSESSQVSMYNTYQNRVATAREAFSRASLNYDNAIKEAQLQNNSILAEIAYNALQTQLELSLQGFQYKNTLLTERLNTKLQIDQNYYTRWRDEISQINTENALSEQVRQYNATMAYNKERDKLDRQHDKDMAAINHDYDKLLLEAKTEEENKLIEANKQKEIAVLNQKLINDKVLLKYEHGLENSGSSGSIKKDSGSGKKSTQKSNTSIQKSNTSSEKNKTSTKTAKNTEPTKYPIDTTSLNELGLSGKSAAYISDLVDKGLLIEYVENGKTKFKWAQIVLGRRSKI